MTCNSNFAYILNYLLLIYCISSFKINFLANMNSKLLLLGAIVISYVFNISTEINPESDFLVALNILLLFFLFPYFKTRDYTVGHKVLFFIAGFIIFSQLVYIYEITYFTDLLESIYKRADAEQEFNFFITENRNGGIYFNPNQACKYATMLMGLTFVSLQGKFKWIIISTLMVSVVLTGSRTGLITALAFFAIHIFFLKRNFFLTFLVVAVGLVIIPTLEFNNIRSTQLNDTGSLDYKNEALFFYFSQAMKYDKWNHLAFGNFTSDYDIITSIYRMPQKYNLGFDAEIGFMISTFGVFGLVALILFYVRHMRSLNKKYLLIITPFIFWPVTSTIIFSFKSGMVYLVCLGWCVSKSNILNSKPKVSDDLA
ncbi:hypothetical protein [Flavobacterium sp. 3HN19-14]|uniref:hypothetical protein n=1 Tax=Flavobacterium sp. 3HN19-14 TaxID=3448133 RepID=UPI003EE40B7D